MSYKGITQVLKASLFPDVLFEDLEKKDGLIALVVSVFVLLVATISLYIIKHSQVYDVLREGHNTYRLFFGFAMSAPGIIVMLVMLRIRKQRLDWYIDVCLYLH